MARFVLVYLGWEERLRTGEEANANRRTSENSVNAKFADLHFPETSEDDRLGSRLPPPAR